MVWNGIVYTAGCAALLAVLRNGVTGCVTVCGVVLKVLNTVIPVITGIEEVPDLGDAMIWGVGRVPAPTPDGPTPVITPFGPLWLPIPSPPLAPLDRGYRG